VSRQDTFDARLVPSCGGNGYPIADSWKITCGMGQVPHLAGDLRRIFLLRTEDPVNTSGLFYDPRRNQSRIIEVEKIIFKKGIPSHIKEMNIRTLRRHVDLPSKQRTAFQHWDFSRKSVHRRGTHDDAMNERKRLPGLALPNRIFASAS
jgi:hypothetical protein